MWLGMRIINRNVAKIEPKFFIDQRIGTKDRALHVQLLSRSEQNLTVYGVDTPVFQMHPAVFAIRINGLIFTSASCDFLISYYFGLPSSPHDCQYRSDGQTECSVNSGTNTFSVPWAPIPMVAMGTWIGQPIAHLLVQNDDPRAQELYDTPWCRSLGLNRSNGRCNVYSSMRGEPKPYPKSESIDWLPRFEDDRLRATDWIVLAQQAAFEAYGMSPSSDGANKSLLQKQASLLKSVRSNPESFRSFIEFGDLAL